MPLLLTAFRVASKPGKSFQHMFLDSTIYSRNGTLLVSRFCPDPSAQIMRRWFFTEGNEALSSDFVVLISFSSTVPCRNCPSRTNSACAFSIAQSNVLRHEMAPTCVRAIDGPVRNAGSTVLVEKGVVPQEWALVVRANRHFGRRCNPSTMRVDDFY